MRVRGNKLGHQAPKGYVFNRYFHRIEIEGDLHYCASHDFVYDSVEEDRKLHNGEACYHTDARYWDGKHNYYKNCALYWVRSFWGKKYELSLKACMRFVEQCRNIPVGTIVRFEHDWYYTSKKSKKPIRSDYYYKVRKENRFDPQYEINGKSWSRDFHSDEWAQELTAELRANGFLVSVSKGNPDFIFGMLNTASKYAGGKVIENRDDGGQIATAYGHGMRIGFSTGKDTYRGYGDGVDNVLFDYFQEFNKWSQCYHISKSLSPKEIVEELLKSKK